MRSAWALAVALLLVLAPVFAAQGTPIGAGTPQDQGAYQPQTNNTAENIQAGHVYKVDLELLEVSKWWAGIYGTISSGIVLGDSSGNKFFEWSLTLPEYIVITYSTDINWDSLTAVSSAEASDFGTIINNEFTALNYGSWNPSNDESVDKTFTATEECISGKGQTIAALVYGDIDGGGASPGQEWPVCAYKAQDSDSNDRAVYVAMVYDNGKAYNGEDADYQAIIAATDTGVTIHFWKVDFS